VKIGGGNTASRVHMLPLSKKHISECQKFNQIFLLRYAQFKCACKVLPKTNTFYGLCKKDKYCHMKCLIFSTKMVSFTHATRLIDLS
jgi:hypothetical protein